MRQLTGWGARVDRLTPDQAVRELEPDLAIDPAVVAAVFFVRRSGWLDPLAMAHGTMAAAVERYGAELVRGEVVGMRTGGGMIEAVQLGRRPRARGRRRHQRRGSGANRVAGLAGAELPIERTPGLLLVTAPAPARLQRVVQASEVHLRPDGGGRVMVQWEPLDSHATEGAPLAVDDPLVGEAMARARAVMPALSHVEVQAVLLGVRPVPKDGFPIVGFDLSIANLYHAVTHSGITLAARLAILVTEELTGGDPEPLEPYRPSRLAHRAGARSMPVSGSSN